MRRCRMSSSRLWSTWSRLQRQGRLPFWVFALERTQNTWTLFRSERKRKSLLIVQCIWISAICLAGKIFQNFGIFGQALPGFVISWPPSDFKSALKFFYWSKFRNLKNPLVSPSSLDFGTFLQGSDVYSSLKTLRTDGQTDKRNFKFSIFPYRENISHPASIPRSATRTAFGGPLWIFYKDPCYVKQCK